MQVEDEEEEAPLVAQTVMQAFCSHSQETFLQTVEEQLKLAHYQQYVLELVEEKGCDWDSSRRQAITTSKATFELATGPIVILQQG